MFLKSLLVGALSASAVIGAMELLSSKIGSPDEIMKRAAQLYGSTDGQIRHYVRSAVSICHEVQHGTVLPPQIVQFDSMIFELTVYEASVGTVNLHPNDVERAKEVLEVRGLQLLRDAYRAASAGQLEALEKRAESGLAGVIEHATCTADVLLALSKERRDEAQTAADRAPRPSVPPSSS